MVWIHITTTSRLIIVMSILIVFLYVEFFIMLTNTLNWVLLVMGYLDRWRSLVAYPLPYACLSNALTMNEFRFVELGSNELVNGNIYFIKLTLFLTRKCWRISSVMLNWVQINIIFIFRFRVYTFLSNSDVCMYWIQFISIDV